MSTLEASLNFPSFILQKAQQHATKVAAYYQSSKERRAPIEYKSLLWHELATKIKSLAGGLLEMGLLAGERVAILGNTSPNWTVSDIAIMACGGIVVPIYPASSHDEIAYVLNHSGARFLFVEDRRAYEQIAALIGSSKLENIFCFEQFSAGDFTPLTIDQLQERGCHYLSTNAGLLQARLESLGREDLATIVFTSGTSGQLKGVKLTHRNIIEQLRAVSTRIPIYDTSRNALLAFLTSAHIYERVAGEWFFLSQACPIYFCSKIERLNDYLQESKATVLLVVPLILERLKKKILAKLQRQPFQTRTIVQSALRLAIDLKGMEYASSNPILSQLACLTHKLVYKLILEKVKLAISPTLRIIISGGAALNSSTNLFFHAIGIYISEGYGLTETTGPVYANNLERPYIGSVGQVIGKVQTKIAEDREILLKGDVISSGYWEAPEESAKAFTDDGWYHTGDLGRLDQKGNLWIIGRKKDLIVTMGGKNVSPALIEEKLTESDLINQAAIFGDGQKWLVALITINQEEFLSKVGQPYNPSYSEDQWLALLDRAESYKLIQEEITCHCASLAEYEKVKRFLILPKPFSVETGELTPTLKLKRRIIAEKYADLIARLYE
ncbi:MAG: long-chain fatty acid--CoA ligase [Candidatus Caenarcaniphilales bacterium]|nr:long-chain fatty acid--CoA ligase [Candidatus Caenarcaniphilales bacterium]